MRARWLLVLFVLHCLVDSVYGGWFSRKASSPTGEEPDEAQPPELKYANRWGPYYSPYHFYFRFMVLIPVPLRLVLIGPLLKDILLENHHPIGWFVRVIRELPPLWRQFLDMIPGMVVPFLVTFVMSRTVGLLVSFFDTRQPFGWVSWKDTPSWAALIFVAICLIFQLADYIKVSKLQRTLSQVRKALQGIDSKTKADPVACAQQLALKLPQSGSDDDSRDTPSWTPDPQGRQGTLQVLTANVARRVFKSAIEGSQDIRNLIQHAASSTATALWKQSTGLFSPRAQQGVDNGSVSDGKAVKRANRRQKMCEEVISSELSYVTSLRVMMDSYAKPMREAAFQRQTKVSSADVDAVFSSLEPIVALHEDFYDRLSKQTDTNMFQSFVHGVDFQGAYRDFISKFDTQIMKSVDKINKSKKVAAFLQQQQAQCGQALMSFLIMPVQRIPRYRMLLEGIQELTEPDNPELTDIESALERIMEIAAGINEHKRHVENMAKLVELQQQIKHLHLVLPQPHRKLVRHAMVQQTVPKRKEYEFYLFNDLLLWLRSNKEVKGFMDLAFVSHEQGLDESPEAKGTEHTLTLRVPEGGGPKSPDIMTLAFKSTEDRDAWMQDVEQGHEWCKTSKRARELMHEGKMEVPERYLHYVELGVQGVGSQLFMVFLLRFLYHFTRHFLVFVPLVGGAGYVLWTSVIQPMKLLKGLRVPVHEGLVIDIKRWWQINIVG